MALAPEPAMLLPSGRRELGRKARRRRHQEQAARVVDVAVGPAGKDQVAVPPVFPLFSTLMPGLIVSVASDCCSCRRCWAILVNVPAPPEAAEREPRGRIDAVQHVIAGGHGRIAVDERGRCR